MMTGLQIKRNAVCFLTILENNLRYGNRGIEKIEDVQKYKVIRIPENILMVK